MLSQQFCANLPVFTFIIFRLSGPRINFPLAPVPGHSILFSQLPFNCHMHALTLVLPFALFVSLQPRPVSQFFRTQCPQKFSTVYHRRRLPGKMRRSSLTSWPLGRFLSSPGIVQSLEMSCCGGKQATRFRWQTSTTAVCRRRWSWKPVLWPPSAWRLVFELLSPQYSRLG